MTEAPPLPTVGEIARRLNVSTHRVVDLIEARGIRPLRRAGIARVFAESDVRRIAGELKQPNRRRRPVGDG